MKLWKGIVKVCYNTLQADATRPKIFFEQQKAWKCECFRD